MGYPRNQLRTVRAALLAAIFFVLPFTARSASAAYATLAWTSPADNGTARVYTYDLRISTRAISGTDTTGWWNAATKISMTGKLPSMPGTPENILLGGLVNGVRYYAILRSADNLMNWSRYSNVATFTPVTSITGVEAADAPALVLGVPRPTPTSGRADISLDLPKSMDVDASIFDAQGRLIRTLEHGVMAGGPHVLHWDGRINGGGDAASGIYYVRVAAGEVSKRVKLVVVR
jgi:hypothetical protein